jgi:hypothetical protein
MKKRDSAMGKYEPLESFLRTLTVSQYRASFRELEQLLGFKLPASASKYPAWWSNDETGHSHARAWLGAGWRTEELDLAARKVTFARAAADAARSKRDPWGCMAGTVTIMPGTDLTAPSEEEWAALEGRLVNE